MLQNWVIIKEHLCEVAIEYNKINKIRREIEAKYVVKWTSKVKAEALFIVEHSEEWDKYQQRKEELIKAESIEEQASKTYYQARDDQKKGGQVDSAISKLVKDEF